MYRISERMCLVTVRKKLTAYNKRLVNPYVSIQIEKKIEILYDLKLKKKPARQPSNGNSTCTL